MKVKGFQVVPMISQLQIDLENIVTLVVIKKNPVQFERDFF